MKVYFFPGIAADGRMFKHICLPEGFEPVYINWIKPIKNETLHEYASRIGEKIDAKESFCLVGASLGGIMASEIANRYIAKATIIIGSVPVSSQLPGYYRWLRKIKIQKIIPGQFYQYPAIIKNLFDMKGEDKKIVAKMIQESDPAFIRWGINAVLNWTNNQMPVSLTHIHGTRDKVFPFPNTSPTHIIQKGNHVLVMSRPKEINQIIREVLEAI